MPPRSPITGTPQELLHSAAMLNDVATIETLLDTVDVDVPAKDKATALSFAAAYGSLDAMRVLLAKGANPNAPDYKQMTPLHVAVANTQPAAVALLLRYGADSNAEDNYGNSPLIAALGSSKMVELTGLLLEHGANPLQENKAGMSPYAVTKNRGDEEAHNLMAAYLDTAPQ